jgi:two-component sensor histidine kinase
MTVSDQSGPDEVLPNIEASPDSASPQAVSPEIRLRIRQQAILAELGVFALQRKSLTELLENSVRMAAEGLRCEFCKVLEYMPEENRLLLRAGVGWEPGLIGTASVGADLASPAGYALHTGAPVISNHLENEERFRTPDLLRTHDVRRAINVILQGDGAPFGVLEVDSRSEGEFSEHDLSFLQGAANILGMAIERERYERNLRTALEHQQVLVQEINHRVKNSLQLVGSMFHLQARASPDPTLAQALEEAYGRVTAVARVHERLYRDPDVRSVDLATYLSDVSDDLNRVVAPCSIEFNASENLRIGTDRAVLVALLVGELATNSAKHAYGEDKPGLITVRLSRSNAKTIAISVCDEGRGFPDGFDPRQSRGFGMTIIRAFLQQSGAKLDVRRLSPGTEFVVEVPMD